MSIERFIENIRTSVYQLKRETFLLTRLSHLTQSLQFKLQNLIIEIEKNPNEYDYSKTLDSSKVTFKNKILFVRKLQHEIFCLQCEKVSVVEKMQKIVKSFLLMLEKFIVILKNEYREIPLKTYYYELVNIIEKNINLTIQNTSNFEHQLIDYFSSELIKNSYPMQKDLQNNLNDFKSSNKDQNEDKSEIDLGYNSNLNLSLSEKYEIKHKYQKIINKQEASSQSPSFSDKINYAIDGILSSAKSLTEVISEIKSQKEKNFEVNSQKEIFCICKRQSYGKMVECDNPNCNIRWFHYDCVGINQLPESGSWYCDSCKPIFLSNIFD